MILTYHSDYCDLGRSLRILENIYSGLIKNETESSYGLLTLFYCVFQLQELAVIEVGVGVKDGILHVFRI